MGWKSQEAYAMVGKEWNGQPAKSESKRTLLQSNCLKPGRGVRETVVTGPESRTIAERAQRSEGIGVMGMGWISVFEADQCCVLGIGVVPAVVAEADQVYPCPLRPYAHGTPLDSVPVHHHETFSSNASYPYWVVELIRPCTSRVWCYYRLVWMGRIHIL
jgi:hypothetical protein